MNRSTPRTTPPLDRGQTTDPISGHRVEITDDTLWLQEGDPDEGITLYFESRETLETYRRIPVEHPETGLSRSLSNDTDEGWDEG
ncbi:MAG: hypothetical protein D6721_01735 [Gammaproteobacteria bacterium]|nr:MAG: hypothetical protein D6721_01735 [Gammaproteobacteria bacterium]